jgi:branched-chain amino acid transport system permease protein
MEHFLQLMIMGIAMGSIYSLVALGVVLIFNAIQSLNFAQGEFLMLGAYFVLSISGALKLPYVLDFFMVLGAMGLLGYFFEKIFCAPLRRASYVTVLVSTLGMSIFFKNVAQYIWGPLPQFYDEPFGNSVIRMGNLSLPIQYLFVIFVTLILVLALFLFLERSSLGHMLKAASEDQQAAALMGIPVERMISLAFVIASILAGIGGILLAPIFFITLEMGYLVGLKAFAAMIVGGFGSIPGAILGGLVLGVIEILGASYISSTYKDVFSFGLLILILLIRPQGFLGEKVADKV